MSNTRKMFETTQFPKYDNSLPKDFQMFNVCLGVTSSVALHFGEIHFLRLKLSFRPHKSEDRNRTEQERKSILTKFWSICTQWDFLISFLYRTKVPPRVTQSCIDFKHSQWEWILFAKGSSLEDTYEEARKDYVWLISWAWEVIIETWGSFFNLFGLWSVTFCRKREVRTWQILRRIRLICRIFVWC